MNEAISTEGDTHSFSPSMAEHVIALLVDRLGGDVVFHEEDIARSKLKVRIDYVGMTNDWRFTLDHVTQRGETLAGEIVDDAIVAEPIGPPKLLGTWDEQGSTRIVGEGEEISPLPPYSVPYIEAVEGYRHVYRTEKGTLRYTRDANHQPDRRCPECRI